MPFIAAIDQGTSSTRFIIFNEKAEIQASHQVEFQQIQQKSGWLEHSAEEIVDSVNTCIYFALREFEKKGHKASEIAGVGITNQRETTVVWDTKTGKSLYNAVVWSDMRTVETVAALECKDGAEGIRDECGLPLSTYFSGVKLRWLLDNVPAVQEAEKANTLSFGTIDSWLVYNLTGGKLHLTDPTNASRTMLMDIRTLKYSDRLIKFFGFERVTLPEIRSSSELLGEISTGPGQGLQISGILGDQSAALVGHCAFESGEAKNTYGTGCFLLFNTGEEPVISKNGLLTTVGYAFKGHKPVYALEGSIAVAGSAVKWARDKLEMIKSASEIEQLASKVPNSAGVVFVTGFSGLFAPYWRNDVRGTILGITGYTTKHHIARALLEAICYQSKAILDAMNKDSGRALHVVGVDGGMTNSNFFMQLQADILGIKVERPNMREATALGSALAAGFATGVYKDMDDLKGVTLAGDVFEPKSTEEDRIKWMQEWERAVQQSIGWAK